MAEYRNGLERLEGHKYANAHIQRYSDGIIQLWSYRTMILEYNTREKTIHCTGLYSMTTRKHIGWFMNQFFNNKYNYHDIKYIYNNNLSLLIL